LGNFGNQKADKNLFTCTLNLIIFENMFNTALIFSKTYVHTEKKVRKNKIQTIFFLIKNDLESFQK